MEKNICRFLPNMQREDINILNFVYETKQRPYIGMDFETVYKMHIVVRGTGKLHISQGVYDLNDGDVFFTHPAMLYAIESVKDFEYMYISCLGLRMNRLMDNLRISSERCIFKNQTELKPIWENSIIDNKSILNLRCEGILLYSFSILGEKTIEEQKGNNNAVMKIKEYIEENFSDNSLSLETISNECSYNKKYISRIFKQKFGIGISQYITRIRIQYACTLMERGFTSVSDIAFQSGFSEPMYFSKVFKKIMGVSPKEHITFLKTQNMSGFDNTDSC